ncbi:MAG TPA: hypothetical protein VGO50_09705 [Pyrinomonadaceae bacterium]|jgi:hypothetical protein|nr:hypothetical protein [Pyrinomonadaceae bacterium]
MTNRQIVEEISRLPLSEKISIVETILKDINKGSQNETSLAEGAEKLLEDYQHDAELIAFTSLDSETFYETK